MTFQIENVNHAFPDRLSSKFFSDRHGSGERGAASVHQFHSVPQLIRRYVDFCHDLRYSMFWIEMRCRLG